MADDGVECHQELLHHRNKGNLPRSATLGEPLIEGPEGIASPVGSWAGGITTSAPMPLPLGSGQAEIQSIQLYAAAFRQLEADLLVRTSGRTLPQNNAALLFRYWRLMQMAARQLGYVFSRWAVPVALHGS